MKETGDGAGSASEGAECWTERPGRALGAAPSGREHSECKGPVVGKSSACVRNRKVSIAWAQCDSRGEAGSRACERCGPCLQGMDAVARGLDVGLIAREKHWRVFTRSDVPRVLWLEDCSGHWKRIL